MDFIQGSLRPAPESDHWHYVYEQCIQFALRQINKLQTRFWIVAIHVSLWEPVALYLILCSLMTPGLFQGGKRQDVNFLRLWSLVTGIILANERHPLIWAVFKENSHFQSLYLWLPGTVARLQHGIKKQPYTFKTAAELRELGAEASAVYSTHSPVIPFPPAVMRGMPHW